MYKGVPCENDISKCCYNAALWCPSDDDCRTDNGAYPFGDQRTFDNQMFDSGALTPFPNAIMVRCLLSLVFCPGIDPVVYLAHNSCSHFFCSGTGRPLSFWRLATWPPLTSKPAVWLPRRGLVRESPTFWPDCSVL
jgi:hypothetical protein